MSNKVISAQLMEKMVNLIKEIVEESPGIKEIDLVVKFTAHLLQTGETIELSGVPIALNFAVKQGEILEIEYVLSNMPYRSKSIYFPKETILSYKGKELWNK